ncbi:MAG TPA: type II toxin-antitoxin system YafQ family toxin [Roseiarcus sp.]|nr:type II toxin-antitoxin system YafQ family toxin [Roseiarcus sp.]
MRTIRAVGRYKRDYRRAKAGGHGGKLEDLLGEVIAMLAADEPLPPRFHDHALAGRWKDFRDCHVRPDLVLIYRKPEGKTLELVRLGSHSELGF